ncbi:uncharacterized protein LOC134540205 isoform X3 [Bacillus rossius redtenbacheri]|uniref:uncharacterized protein LOC134540205 isoform X3 n=1 Tax=Bacillus rossius redtenbacheri TaxID=93214 RepID=UPI002FDE2A0E
MPISNVRRSRGLEKLGASGCDRCDRGASGTDPGAHRDTCWPTRAWCGVPGSWMWAAEWGVCHRGRAVWSEPCHRQRHRPSGC